MVTDAIFVLSFMKTIVFGICWGVGLAFWVFLDELAETGAVEFLTKPIDDDALLSAIKSAVKRSAAALDDQTELQALRQCHESLTPREREVMRLVVAGMLNKQIGMKLGISEITVKAHRGKMMQKMKAESLADLVKTAVRLGLASARNPWHTTER